VGWAELSCAAASEEDELEVLSMMASFRITAPESDFRSDGRPESVFEAFEAFEAFEGFEGFEELRRTSARVDGRTRNPTNSISAFKQINK
jgi:hypothetical protein